MVMKRTEKSSGDPVPEGEDSDNASTESWYRQWLGSKPAPGEVFVYTGEASAANREKLRWSPTKGQRALLRVAIEQEVKFVNELYQEDSQDSYASRIGPLVDEKLRSVGVDPVTLKLLPVAPGGSEHTSNGSFVNGTASNGVANHDGPTNDTSSE